ncbi:MAG: carbohydrate kinase family protein [Actinomycetota bacterium]
MGTISIVGNVNVDIIVYPASELPPPGGEWTVERVDVRTGGAAAISALTMSALGGGPVLIGCVGDDPVAGIIRDELIGAGVECVLRTVPGTSTGVSVAFEAPARDRAFLTSLGSLCRFDASMIPATALGPHPVLFCGYFLLPALRGEPTLRLLTDVRDRGGTTLFDCGADPGGWPKQTRREILDMLPLVDVFLPNADEAAVLTGERDAVTAGQALQRHSGGVVVVKLGKEGAVGIGPDGTTVRTPAPLVQVADTTGAGDAFNGGLLHAMDLKQGWAEATDFATRVASTVVSRPTGTRYPALTDVVPG